MSKKRKRYRSDHAQSSELVDSVTHANLLQWRKAHRARHEYYKLLYFDLEGQRAIRRDELHEALRRPAIPYDFESWVRIVNYRYTLHPLSSVGSLKTIGGRFNVGIQIDPELFKPFPAFYVADTEMAARAEYFSTSGVHNGLTPEELALTKPESFSVLRLRGSLDRVFDLRAVSNLREFIGITKRFTLSPRVRRTGRLAGLDHHVIKDEEELYESLMAQDWRFLPAQFDVPSNPQIFGNMLVSDQATTSLQRCRSDGSAFRPDWG